MIYTTNIRKAISFAIKTHQGYQDQKRKGKDLPYISHPLTVGLILSQAGASEDVIVAGILHDTIEDSIDDKKVTPEMLEERFAAAVAQLVASVTEDKNVERALRKEQAIEHIKNFSNDSVIVKSADVLSNTTEILDDYEKCGDKVFERFGDPKDKTLERYSKLIDALLDRWPESPLADDLQRIKEELSSLQNTQDVEYWAGRFRAMTDSELTAFKKDRLNQPVITSSKAAAHGAFEAEVNKRGLEL